MSEKVCYDMREEWCIIWGKPGVDCSVELKGLKNKGLGVLTVLTWFRILLVQYLLNGEIVIRFP